MHLLDYQLQLLQDTSYFLWILFAVFKQIVHRLYNIQVFCISVLLIFKMQEANGALFLKAICLPFFFFFFETVIFPLIKIYASLKSHKSDLSIECFKPYLFAWFVSIFSSTWLIKNFYLFFSIKSRHFIEHCT